VSDESAKRRTAALEGAERRLDRFFATKPQPDAVLEDACLDTVSILLQPSGDNDADVDAYDSAGFLLWCRVLANPDDEADINAATSLQRMSHMSPQTDEYLFTLPLLPSRLLIGPPV
jgi:hypothetical protein